MDCDKFDQILIDAVYDELDELTLAAAKRHADTCQHCQAAWSGLRATRKIGILPLVEAPAGLETHIMQAAREAHRNLPWPKRVGRAVSWAGSYAMRPQMAMAALLVLMLGSSIIFLRAKPDRSGALSRISVTERGVPEQAAEEPRADLKATPADERVPAGGRLAKREDDRGAAPAPMAAAPSPTAALDFARPAESEGRAQKGGDKVAAAEPMAETLRPKNAAPAAGAPMPDDFGSNSVPRRSAGSASEKKKTDTPSGGALAGPGVQGGSLGQSQDAFAAAMELFNAGRYAEAEKAFDHIEASGSKDAARAALMAGKSSENGPSGCGKAAAKYEAAASRYGGSSPGAEAQWFAANCYRTIGNYDKAYALYSNLRGVAGYRDRAEDQLENLKILQQQQQVQQQQAARARAAAPAKPAAPPPVRAQPASPKATTDVAH